MGREDLLPKKVFTKKSHERNQKTIQASAQVTFSRITEHEILIFPPKLELRLSLNE